MNKGKIIQIMGPVVDVAFPDELPPLRRRWRCSWTASAW